MYLHKIILKFEYPFFYKCEQILWVMPVNKFKPETLANCNLQCVFYKNS